MLDRRNFVLSGSIVLGLGRASDCVQSANAAPGKSAAGPVSGFPRLKAIVSLGGQNYVYDSATGEDMGTYVGEFVKQRCVRVTNNQLPMTVFFRPDVEGDRVEVVVELGRMWDRKNLEHITEPYSVEITRNDQSLAKVDVPYHWWWARWRWQTALRPLVRSVEELRAKKLILSYGRTSVINSAPDTVARTYSAPMDTCGLLFDSSTGERSEIGPFTEPQADYILNGSDLAFKTMMAQAEACSTAPIHWRDERTGALLDFQRYPGASMNETNGNPLIPRPPVPKYSDPKFGSKYFHVETSHTPSLAYLPYLLTDDPYLLEELQALGSLAIGFSAYFRDKYKAPGLVTIEQTRGFAWSMRSLFQLGKVTPDVVPSWLLPKKYWLTCVGDNRRVAQMYMDSPARVHSYFRQMPRAGTPGSWQNCFISFIVGWAIELGYTEWKAFYDWHLPGVLALCDGKSGWSRQYPTPYFWFTTKVWPAIDFALIADSSMDAITHKDWAAAWAFYKEHQGIDDSSWDGHTIMTKGIAYTFYLYGALKMAQKLGHNEATEPLSWLEAEIPQMPNARGADRVNGFAKWSIVSD